MKFASLFKMGSLILWDFIFPPTEYELLVRRAQKCDLFAMIKIEKPFLKQKNIYSILPYKTPLVRACIHELKYRGNMKAARLLSCVFFDFLVEELSSIIQFEGQEPVVMPMPITKAHYKDRGFNQMEIIYNMMWTLGLKNFLKEKYYAMIFRRDNVESQARTAKNLRQKNEIEFGIFNETKIVNRTVIILEDVVTTGNTFKAAESILLKNGARRVILYSLAH